MAKVTQRRKELEFEQTWSEFRVNKARHHRDVLSNILLKLLGSTWVGFSKINTKKENYYNYDCIQFGFSAIWHKVYPQQDVLFGGECL